jgi:N-acetyl-anhydromuramyl-L-alanine amidase AmpD
MLKEILINPIDNFIKEENDKKYIIICDTLRDNFDKYISSLKKKTYAPAFVVKKDGTIHKLYNEKYYTEYINIEKINKFSIYIALENSGKLFKSDKLFYNWCEEVILSEKVNEIITNKEFSYYENYTNKQIEALGHLIIYLGNKHNLPLKEINIKNKEDNPIIFLSSIDVYSYSPNPTLNIEKLNSIIFKN